MYRVLKAIRRQGGFQVDGIAIEVTHRSKRRLFGLAILAPLRDEVAPSRPSMPGRGPGRPPSAAVEADTPRHFSGRSSGGRCTTANSRRPTVHG